MMKNLGRRLAGFFSGFGSEYREMKQNAYIRRISDRAPCKKHCEARAFEFEIRRLKKELEKWRSGCESKNIHGKN